MPYHFALDCLARVELQVANGEGCGTLLPFGSELAVIKSHVWGCRIVYPPPDKRIAQQLRNLSILQIPRGKTAFAMLHELVHAHEQLVCAIHSCSLFASDMWKAPYILVVGSS